MAWGKDSAATQLPPGLHDIKAISPGSPLALKMNGTVVAWGDNRWGQANVPPGLTNVLAVAGSSTFNLALLQGAPPPAPLRLRSFAWGDGLFTVSFPTRTGAIYTLESRDDPSSGNWVPVDEAAGTGGEVSLSDPNAGAIRRFYRVGTR